MPAGARTKPPEPPKPRARPKAKQGEPKTEYAILWGGDRNVGYFVRVDRIDSHRAFYHHTDEKGVARNEDMESCDSRRVLIRNATLELWQRLLDSELMLESHIKRATDRLTDEWWRQVNAAVYKAGGYIANG